MIPTPMAGEVVDAVVWTGAAVRESGVARADTGTAVAAATGLGWRP
jgi:hypothetical protein